MKKSIVISSNLESGFLVIRVELNYWATQHRRIMPLIKHAGFNALELMLVLAVIAVGIGVAIHTMTGNSNSQNANQMVSDVSSLVSNIKGAYMSSAQGYTNISTPNAIQGGLIPTDLRVTNGTSVQNQFQSGEVTLEAANNGEAFSITYTSVPSAICAKAVSALAGSAFLSIAVGGTSVYDSVDTSVVVDASTIAGACSSGKTITIVFTAS